MANMRLGAPLTILRVPIRFVPKSMLLVHDLIISDSRAPIVAPILVRHNKKFNWCPFRFKKIPISENSRKVKCLCN